MQIHSSNGRDSTPKSSGHHLGICVPVWMAYAPLQGSHNAVPLLCGRLGVQGASPYNIIFNVVQIALHYFVHATISSVLI